MHRAAQAIQENGDRGVSGTAIDLFAGAGGVTAGLKKANATVVAAVELNSDACATYRHNHGEVNLLQENISDVDPVLLLHETGLKRGELTLLGACAPVRVTRRLDHRVLRIHATIWYLRFLTSLMRYDPEAWHLRMFHSLFATHALPSLSGAFELWDTACARKSSTPPISAYRNGVDDWLSWLLTVWQMTMSRSSYR